MFSTFIHSFRLPLLIICVFSLLLIIYSCSTANEKGDSLFYANGDDGVYIQPAPVFQDSITYTQIDIT